MPFAALDATAEALARRVLADVPADRPRGAADVDRLPAPLVPVLHARLAAAVEAAAPMPSAWLDAAPVREATEAWLDAARGAVAFPTDEWPRAVREAATRALAHLVRPAETLAAVAFLDRPATLPMADALDRIRVFGPYPYLPQIAARYAERKGLDTIDRAGLEQLFLRIDRRMASTFGPDDWATLLGPLLDLVGPVGSPAGTVPTALLRPLFMTKGAGAVAVELEGIDAVSPADLRAVLDRALVPTDVGPEGPPPPTLVASPPAAEAADAGPADVESQPDEPRRPDAEPVPSLPVDEADGPPTIGSKYLAPEYDGDDASAVLGPPRPAGSSAPDDAPASAQDDVAEGSSDADASASDVGADERTDGDRDAAGAPVPSEPGAPEPEFEETPSASSPDLPTASADEAVPETDDAPPDGTPPTGWRPLDAFETSLPPADVPSPEDEPLWRRLARSEEEAAADSEATTPAADEEEPLWKRFAQSDLAARLPVTPPSPDSDAAGGSELDTLEARVLGPDARERRDWFVEDLFDGSPSAYHDTLGRIDQATTYTEATSIVSSDVFRAHRVNPYTESAVAFIDAIQTQFDAP